MLLLKSSGYGCHIDGLFTRALSYADDITLISPSIRGLNAMIDICSQFALDYSLTFNSKKSVCIKFGENVKDCERIKLGTVYIDWVDKIKHLGNYIDSTLSDKLDCKMKMSLFIGHVNKLNATFGNLQSNIISRLFKTYCCSFYGSQIWKVNSVCFDKVCTLWNKSVRRIYNIPYTSHTWMLGPLMNQYHIRHQLKFRTIRFLYSMCASRNSIVMNCIQHARCNANSPIGYNIAYLRNYHNFNNF